MKVDAARMRANLDATRGAVFAEKAVILLSAELGKEAARRKVEEALRDTGASPSIPGLTTPEGYLGSAEEFRRRLLEGE
jgi:3-carboxy-cis,cis-muconate cycloisomerase